MRTLPCSVAPGRIWGGIEAVPGGRDTRHLSGMVIAAAVMSTASV